MHFTHNSGTAWRILGDSDSTFSQCPRGYDNLMAIFRLLGPSGTLGEVLQPKDLQKFLLETCFRTAVFRQYEETLKSSLIHQLTVVESLSTSVDNESSTKQAERDVSIDLELGHSRLQIFATSWPPPKVMDNLL